MCSNNSPNVISLKLKQVFAIRIAYRKGLNLKKLLPFADVIISTRISSKTQSIDGTLFSYNAKNKINLENLLI